jgi:hypothetical protein
MATVPQIDLSELEDLPPDERAYVEKVLAELAVKGESPLLHSLWEADYVTKPVSIDTFLDEDYFMGKIGKNLFPRWREDLRVVCDPRNQIAEWILAGGIGIGKTFAGVLALVYKLYELTCRRNPQLSFGLAEASPLVFAFFNIFKYLAVDMSYGYFWSFLGASPYFKNLRLNAKSDKSEITELSRNIRTVVGATALHALGMNIFAGILDEMNFGRGGRSNDPADKGQVESAYIGVRDRIESRFMDPRSGSYPGLLCLVSSHGDQEGFLSKHIEKIGNSPHTYISSYAIWEVKEEDYAAYLGPQNQHKRFRVLIGDKTRRSEILEPDANPPADYRIIEVPNILREKFELDIDTALQNIAGVATWGSKTLISQKEKFHESIKNSTPRLHPFTKDIVSLGVSDDLTLISYLDKSKITRIWDKSRNAIKPIFFPESDRFIHIDLAVNRDAAGFAMGCINGSKEVTRWDNEGKKITLHDWTFWVDIQLRIKALPGDEIDFGKIRQFIIFLRDFLHFRVSLVSADQFQSVQMLQDLRKAGFKTKQTSVDKTSVPYDVLKLLHMEGRIDTYEYAPYSDEILRLKDIVLGNKRKIDHPAGGSKDVSDAVAGVAFNAFETVGSETVPTLVSDPALLRRPLPVNPMDSIEKVIPDDYGINPKKKMFGK